MSYEMWYDESCITRCLLEAQNTNNDNFYLQDSGVSCE
jgi:hypothetical protein